VWTFFIGNVVAQWSRHWAGNRLILSSNPTSARLWLGPCSVAQDVIPKQMVEYINPYKNNEGLNVLIVFVHFVIHQHGSAVCL
jgi:hypothetical protein